MVKLRIAAIVASMVALSSVARAEDITYIFTGVATGSAGALGFNGVDFNVTLKGVTANVGPFGTEIQNVPLNATFNIGGVVSGSFTGLSNTVILNPAANIIVFGQNQAGPAFAAEGLANPAFGAYDLTTAFPLNSGTPSFSIQTFQTSPLGGLSGDTVTFDSISSMSFEALTAVPELSTWSLMLIGFAGLGWAGYSSAKRRSASAG
ncbi:MAG: hypothetical protein WBQ45_09700 [Roseiarcus sp.]|uniref:hypothetical protein n=1 Tax=Roseiarcus sp. TaxID=1969460 RepID=UPI003BAFD95C